MKALVAILGVLAFIGLLAYLTMGGRRIRVEVCMEHRGRQACRTAGATTEAEALRTAVDNACAQISSGVTESGQCTRSRPLSVRRVE